MNLSAVVIAVCTVLVATPLAWATDGTSGDRASTGYDVRPSEATKRAHEKVDVLTASRAEIERKLDDLNSAYREQERTLAEAKDAVAAAEAEVREAHERVEYAQDQAEAARQVVRGYAIEVYVHPPVAASIGVLSIADTQDAGFATDVLTIMADERRKVVDDFEVKRKIAAMEQSLADEVVAEAQKRSEEAENELERLADLRSEQARFMADMDDRLGNALAEAAALEAIDEQAARELAEQEMELHSSQRVAQLASTAPAPSTQLVSTAATDSGGNGGNGANGSTPRPGGQAPPTTRAPSPTTTTTRPTTTTTRAPVPTTTTRPPSPPSGVVTWNDVVNVGGGIWVHRSIESNARAMLNAARAAGFTLTGGGYRDSASQIATRRANCGPTYYDIYEKPSGQCTPPTAIPGRSMHERGLAMDLKSNGALIISRSNPAFIWLSNNAGRYGFYNLPSEPWHWSTTGH